MENKPGECLVLKQQLQLSTLPCEKKCLKQLFPSYYKKDNERRAEGCWIAHSSLVFLECKKIRDRLIKSLNKRGLNWKTMETLAILHDVGKLSEPYLQGKRVQHNVLSATIMLYHTGDEAMATAIFLHHEAMHWRELLRREMTILRPLPMSINFQTMRTIEMGFSLHEDYDKPLEYLRQIIESYTERETLSVLKAILTRRHYRMKSSRLIRGIRRSSIKGIYLYWPLYVVDNRAASARDGPDAYWITKLKKMKVTESPCETADEILKRHNRPDISLTAIKI